jgi:hypothetical protein
MIACVMILTACPSYARRLKPEKYYQEIWCAEHKGRLEYVLEDRTRVDCLTCEYAVEVEFADKWAEAVGQALYYAMITNKKPGIVIIIEKPEERRFLIRLAKLAKKFNITVWEVDVDGWIRSIDGITCFDVDCSFDSHSLLHPANTQ